MNEESRAGGRDPEGPDPAAELAAQMRAADALIESLEEEVVGLRQELERAGIALKAAQEEVAARGRALDEERARDRGPEGSADEAALRRELSELRQQHADEQLRLRNEHIAALARQREELEEKHRADLAAADAGQRIEELKEEFRREREAFEQGHREEIEVLRQSHEQWEEKLRDGYREQEERHKAEAEALREELAARRSELESTLEEEYDRRFGRERRELAARHESEVRALREELEDRELTMRRDYREVIESQQAEIESLRKKLSDRDREAAEERESALREVKRLAEGRERELRRAHAARLAEAEEEANRRAAALQSQRAADNRALVARHAGEVADVRRGYEERLAAEDERRRLETWALEERLEGVKVRLESEARAYAARLSELEADRLERSRTAEAERDALRAGLEAEVAGLQDRATELEEALAESERLREAMTAELGGLRARAERGELPEPSDSAQETDREEAGRLTELDAQRVLAEERVQDLERRLREAREEGRRKGEELDLTREKLRRLSEPEYRLREGISLFNASEHARTVASISKSFGLPRVHAGVPAGVNGEPPGKPVITFVWEGVAWRRYVSDPTEGVEEPRVYLVGTGDETSEALEGRPNARVDAAGHLKLGVQAR